MVVTAKCTRCGGSAIGSTFTEASSKINHAVGLSRGIKCGDNWNKVQEIKDVTTTPTTVSKPVSKPETVSTPKVEKPKQSTSTKSKDSPVESKSKK